MARFRTGLPVGAGLLRSGEIMPDTDTVPVTLESPAAAVPVAPPAIPNVPDAPPAAPTPEAEPAAATAEQVLPPPVPPVVPEAKPLVSPEMQQYITRLEGQEELRILQDAVTAYATQLEEQEGLTPEQAQKIARQQGARAYQDFNALREQRRSVSDAFEIGQQYGVDPRQLINMPNRAAMLQAAQLATTFTKTQSRLAALEAENAALKKRLAPPQTFATSASAAQPGSSDYLAALKGKGPLPPAAEIDRYVAQRMASS